MQKSTWFSLTIGCVVWFVSFGVHAQGVLEVSESGSSITDGATVEFGRDQVRVFDLDNIAKGGNSRNSLNNITVNKSGSVDFFFETGNLGSLKGNSAPYKLVITYSPDSLGSSAATVRVRYENGSDTEYIINLEGNTGSMSSPEIQITGSGVEILNGQTDPLAINHTDFGVTNVDAVISRSFTVTNTGAGTLNLAEVGLGDSTHFSTNGLSVNSLGPDDSVSFTVTYNARTLGSHSTLVTLGSSDSDEDPYTFAIEAATKEVSQGPVTSGTDWAVIKITNDNELEYPYEIIYGPDGYLWVTERVGKKVVKVDPNGGSKVVMLDLTLDVYQDAGQDGLMGMAIHPDLYVDMYTSNNSVYLAYTYNSGGPKLRIAKYDYNAFTGALDSNTGEVLIDGIDASDDHNSGRLVIGADEKLYYSVGDQGANQGKNRCNEIRSQYLPTALEDYSDYKGKILRMNLDGSVPNDNPVLDGLKTHVYSYGHRNAQGIAFARDGKLYSSEHGPKVDDELNLITSGKNYGWPQISGYYDNFGYTYCDWSSARKCNTNSGSSCPRGVKAVSEYRSGKPANFQPPLGTYNSTTPNDPSGGWLSWPTVGPSSIDVYEAGNIPGWGKSLLVPTLKKGTIFRVELTAAGDGLVGQSYEEFHSSNDRYRDLAINPNGVSIYAITDNTGGTSGPSGTTGVSIENPGVIVELRYVGGDL